VILSELEIENLYAIKAAAMLFVKEIRISQENIGTPDLTDSEQEALDRLIKAVENGE
jgi:hypothetical protein